MNKNLLLILVVVASTISLLSFNPQSKSVDQFQLWKQTFGTPYEPSQDVFRKIIFYQNLQKITLHNKDPTQTYKMALNQFTIFTHQQFKARYLSVLKPYSQQPASMDESYQGPNVEIDWTTKGAVSPIKNQGQCGSCWAFSAIASTQSHALLNNKYVSLSEQQLVDCSDLYGNQGCNGGWAQRALKYIKDRGISTQVQYPYRAVTQRCQKHGGSFKINSVTSVLECKGLESAIMERPISVSVDAANWSHYSSGVFNNCGKSTDHAVLLVGVVGGSWKIKNSWGKTWGQNGFIRLAAGNTCGICLWGASYPH